MKNKNPIYLLLVCLISLSLLFISNSLINISNYLNNYTDFKSKINGINYSNYEKIINGNVELKNQGNVYYEKVLGYVKAYNQVVTINSIKDFNVLFSEHNLLSGRFPKNENEILLPSMYSHYFEIEKGKINIRYCATDTCEEYLYKDYYVVGVYDNYFPYIGSFYTLDNIEATDNDILNVYFKCDNCIGYLNKVKDDYSIYNSEVDTKYSYNINLISDTSLNGDNVIYEIVLKVLSLVGITLMFYCFYNIMNKYLILRDKKLKKIKQILSLIISYALFFLIIILIKNIDPKIYFLYKINYVYTLFILLIFMIITYVLNIKKENQYYNEIINKDFILDNKDLNKKNIILQMKNYITVLDKKYKLLFMISTLIVSLTLTFGIIYKCYYNYISSQNNVRTYSAKVMVLNNENKKILDFIKNNETIINYTYYSGINDFNINVNNTKIKAKLLKTTSSSGKYVYELIINPNSKIEGELINSYIKEGTIEVFDKGNKSYQVNLIRESINNAILLRPDYTYVISQEDYELLIPDNEEKLKSVIDFTIDDLSVIDNFNRVEIENNNKVLFYIIGITDLIKKQYYFNNIITYLMLSGVIVCLTISVLYVKAFNRENKNNFEILDMINANKKDKYSLLISKLKNIIIYNVLGITLFAIFLSLKYYFEPRFIIVSAFISVAIVTLIILITSFINGNYKK